jgi:RTX calcium-binding nonapeptide repeat (4 copies)
MKHSSTLYEGGRMKIRIGISLSVWLWGLVAHASPEVPKTPEATGDMLQGDPVAPGIYEGDVRELSPAPRWKKGQPIREVPKRVYPRPEPVPPPQPSPADPLWEPQSRTDAGKPPRAITPPDLNIAGIGFTGAFPPDTVGDVGPDHYIQMVNDDGGSRVRIFDKSGTRLAGFELDTLAPAGSGACEDGSGDPVVLFDPLADRWLLSELASTGKHLCVYLSRTPDPVSGGFFTYDFAVPRFPDYPKYAVWPDAYYLSSNEPRPAAYALERNRMLNGRPARFRRFTAPSVAGFDFQALTPSDLDGPDAPPAGSPNYFMRHRDDEVHNAGSNDATMDFLEIFEFHVDFAKPRNSTFALRTTIGVAEFDSNLCGLVSSACFPQPGTAVTLDPLREVLMWRLQYRNFGTHETLVGNFVTDVDNTDHGGIRWFELRKTAPGPWTLFQQGTHAPDANHRWMGSIAMDRQGNIALGYSVSSATVFPSIRYAGRQIEHPLGTLPLGEVAVVEGNASQTFATRWGDYSSMNVDPADDCTLWYTTEFIAPGGDWDTRIARFSFPSCLASPGTCRGVPATMTGTPDRDILTGTPSRDVITALGGNDTINGADGNDLICAGHGHDRIAGGNGRDTIHGDGGRDRLFGGTGRDSLNGGPGPDRLIGGRGLDTCNGGSGRDRQSGCER